MVVGRGEVNSFDCFLFSFFYTQDFGNMKSTKDINISKIDKKCKKQGYKLVLIKKGEVCHTNQMYFAFS